ncbi:hypothetical protein V9T40_002266 [Parthenolecanium corni]|uniref:Allatotropin n=1 Tax=Parthenolecanium corni TaxID=536013 RepID=A0AAN9TFY4_9HEMI
MVQLSNTQFTFTALVVITILSLESVELVHCDKYYGRHFSTLQFREKPRSTRGFKGALSTARGFGKRDSPMDSFPEIEAYEQQYSPRERIAVISLLLKHLLQNDPEAVRMLLKKSSESNQGQEITPYELIRHADSGIADNVNSYEEQ